MSSRFSNLIPYVAGAYLLIGEGNSLDNALSGAISNKNDSDKSAIQFFLYAAVRHKVATEELLKLLAPKRPPLQLHAVLSVALAVLIDEPERSHAVCNETVTAVKNHSRLYRSAGFVNAVLRRFCTEREMLLDKISSIESVRFNAPAWWINKMRQSLGKKTAGHVLELQKKKPPLSLYVNPKKTTPERWIARAKENGLEARAVGESGAILEKALPVQKIPGFCEGEVSVQDAGAQLSALFLDPKPGELILDACSAPGGKTANLAAVSGASVIALEISPKRVLHVRENLQRLGIADVAVRSADAADVKSWWDGVPFDSILLDAPCTASGIVRRHPDIPFCRRPEDIASLAKQQKRLLDALWPTLKVGGKLLYVVCSLFKEEGEDQIFDFLTVHPDAREKIPCEGVPAQLRLLPSETEANTRLPAVHDGFFYALLEKVSR